MATNNKRFKNNVERIEYLNKKHEEIKENQENNLVLDFDKALEEEKSKSKKIQINFMNEVFLIPYKMPFNFSTFFLRHCYKKINGKWTIVMPEDKVLLYLELMFGKKFMSKLEEAKDPFISQQFVFENIVPKIMKTWGYDIDTDPEKIKEIQKKMMNQG